MVSWIQVRTTSTVQASSVAGKETWSSIYLQGHARVGPWFLPSSLQHARRWNGKRWSVLKCESVMYSPGVSSRVYSCVMPNVPRADFWPIMTLTRNTLHEYKIMYHKIILNILQPINIPKHNIISELEIQIPTSVSKSTCSNHTYLVIKFYDFSIGTYRIKECYQGNDWIEYHSYAYCYLNITHYMLIT